MLSRQVKSVVITEGKVTYHTEFSLLCIQYRDGGGGGGGGQRKNSATNKTKQTLTNYENDYNAKMHEGNSVLVGQTAGLLIG